MSDWVGNDVLPKIEEAISRFDRPTLERVTRLLLEAAEYLDQHNPAGDE